MKKLINKVKNTTNKLTGKAICAVSNNRGDGTVSQAITISISVVLGALLLAGLYLLFNEIILPTLSERIQQMFDYKG